MKKVSDKWNGKPYYDRPLGGQTEGIDDGREVVMITDFSSCEPAEALCEWSLIDYETEEFNGRLLHAAKNSPAPNVTLDLNVSGWYAVYLWLMGGDSTVPKYYLDYCCVFSQSHGPAVRLTKDGHFSGSFRTFSHDLMRPGVEACFWKCADLTNQKLTIKHQGHTVYLAALELVPLSSPEVKAIQKDRSDASHRKMIVKTDVYGEINNWFIEHLRNRDLFAWIIGMQNTSDYLNPGGCDALRNFVDKVHGLNAECFVLERPSAWIGHLYDDSQRARDFDHHPEWHCKERDGTDTCQCSYAHPEVVEYMLKRARAVAEHGIDGFGYMFNREPGLVRFEQAALEGFEEKHGVDPLSLVDDDERLLEWRAEIITNYLRQVRKMLDEVASEKGFDRIKMVHITLANKAANHLYSFDIPTWIEEGLVDILVPYPWSEYSERWLAQGFIDVDVRYYSELVKGTDTKVFPMWLSGIWRDYWTPEHIRFVDYFKKAKEQYKDGADGIAAWDLAGMRFSFDQDRWMRLGHKDKLDEWIENDYPLPPRLNFTKYAGKTPNPFPPGTGG